MPLPTNRVLSVSTASTRVGTSRPYRPVGPFKASESWVGRVLFTVPRRVIASARDCCYRPATMSRWPRRLLPLVVAAICAGSGGHRTGQQSPRTPHGNVEWRYFRSAQQRQPGRSHRDRRERPRDRWKLEAQRHVPRPPDAQQHLKRLPPLPPQARSRSDLRRRRRRLPQAGRREPVRRRHLAPGQRSRFERHAASRSFSLNPASGRRSLSEPPRARSVALRQRPLAWLTSRRCRAPRAQRRRCVACRCDG